MNVIFLITKTIELLRHINTFYETTIKKKSCIHLKISKEYQFILTNKSGENIDWRNITSIRIDSGDEISDADFVRCMERYYKIHEKILSHRNIINGIFYNNDSLTLRGDILRGWFVRRNITYIRSFYFYDTKNYKKYKVYGDLKKLSEITSPVIINRN